MSPEAEVSQKRKASSVLDGHEEISKRHRVDDDDHHDSRSQNPNSSPTEPRHRDVDADAGTARRSVVSRDEEKRRGKRLFGGLLNTLSQTSTSSQHKKRREIELRQQERAQKQRAEDDKRRAEKLARITEVRWQEQIKFDEKAMRVRHANMLAMAHSLKTHAQPPIYFRPWKLSKEQEDSIDDQIQDAKAIIAREVDAFNDRKEAHEQRYGRSRPSIVQNQPAPAIAESSADAPPAPEAAHVDAAAAGSTNTASLYDNDRLDREPHDESGDVVEDAEEDMVIY
ncbi:nuclear protein [Colletotrichum truncatum]|uniref:Nuclear protein n=1 Tax=Colletotrichum truncatum TaxID=5467 RepID=A0ACC3YJC5_COLTU